ncbi:L,D-transpeptidase family protein [Coralliovum pocilloporae]|uniref:L,D-transpeptidase family protein n=1 Tax=Coralliovum pocilloporae TaxID=3066369 RepID=UPI0033074445
MTSPKTTRTLDRRAFVTGLAAGSATLLSSAAQAENPVTVFLKNNRRSAWSQGFDPNRDVRSEVLGAEPVLSHEAGVFIEQAVARYSYIVQKGGWPAVPHGARLRLGSRHRNVPQLRQRLIASGDMAPGADVNDVYDAEAAMAVRRFQARHGIRDDGVVREATYRALNVPADVRLNQLQTNLVRLRAMSGFLGDRFVMVNIPAAEIEAVEQRAVYSRHVAVVGKIDRQTPILNSKIHELNFNPYWHVPKSIIRKDLIPKMQQDPQYLLRNKIFIYDWKGNLLDQNSIDWHTDEATKYLFRQDPGSENSLGSVRINFHNPHAVYLHDTPSQSLFGQNYRFHSSGCVRVHNVRDFVSWLLQPNGDWNRARVDSAIGSGERLDVRIKEKTPLYMTYVTAWATRQGHVHFRPDVYNRDGLGALAQ